MRLVMEPVEVAAEAGEPRRIRHGRRWWTVERVLDRWTWRGRWWRDPSLQGESRAYFLVQCRGGTLEVFRTGDDWVLSRVVD